jgi:hypothetical protein
MRRPLLAARKSAENFSSAAQFSGDMNGGLNALSWPDD